MDSIPKILWLIIISFGIFFIRYALYPYLHKKYLYWSIRKSLKNIAKRYPGDEEVVNTLNKCADAAKQRSEEDKI